MLITDAYGNRFHINLKQIVKAYATSDYERFAVEFSNGDTMWVDLESFKRVTKWLRDVSGRY